MYVRRNKPKAGIDERCISEDDKFERDEREKAIEACDKEKKLLDGFEEAIDTNLGLVGDCMLEVFRSDQSI